MAPDAAIDLGPQATVSRRRLLLCLTRPAVGAVRHRVRQACTGFDPVLSIGTRTHHGGTSHGRSRATAQPEHQADATSNRSNGHAAEEPYSFTMLRSARGGIDQLLDQSLSTASRLARGAGRAPSLTRRCSQAAPSHATLPCGWGDPAPATGEWSRTAEGA